MTETKSQNVQNPEDRVVVKSRSVQPKTLSYLYKFFDKPTVFSKEWDI